MCDYQKAMKLFMLDNSKGIWQESFFLLPAVLDNNECVSR